MIYTTMKIITINNVDNIYFKDNINNVARQSTSCRASLSYHLLFTPTRLLRVVLQRYHSKRG